MVKVSAGMEELLCSVSTLTHSHCMHDNPSKLLSFVCGGTPNNIFLIESLGLAGLSYLALSRWDTKCCAWVWAFLRCLKGGFSHEKVGKVIFPINSWPPFIRTSIPTLTPKKDPFVERNNVATRGSGISSRLRGRVSLT